MNAILTNWMTTYPGFGLMLTALSGLIHAIDPSIPGPDGGTAWNALFGGIGLIFAKDAATK